MKTADKNDLDAMAHEASGALRKVIAETGEELVGQFEHFVKITLLAQDLVKLIEDEASFRLPPTSDIRQAAAELKKLIETRL